MTTIQERERGDAAALEHRGLDLLGFDGISGRELGAGRGACGCC